MDNVKFNLNQSEKIILETIRLNGNSYKSVIVEKSELPFPTVSVGLTALKKDKLIEIEPDENGKDIVKYGSKIWFAGISIGSSNVKVVIGNGQKKPDLSTAERRKAITEITDTFKKIEGAIVSEDENEKGRWRFITPNTYMELADLLSKICDKLADEKETFNFLSFAFTFPGYVDYENQKILDSTCSSFPIRLSCIKDLLKFDTLEKLDEKDISLVIDHNVKASGIYEFSTLKSECSKIQDAIVVYMGLGLGMSLIINGKVFRGIENRSGQYGHIQINNIKNDDYINNFFKGENNEEKCSDGNGKDDEKNYPCLCGQNKCLEQILKHEVFFPLAWNSSQEPSKKEGEITDEDYIQCLKKADFDVLAESLEQNDENNTLLRRKLAFYLGSTLSNLFKILSVKDIVFSGRLSKLYPSIRFELKDVFLKNNCPEINTHVSEEGTFSSALGAVEVAYHNTFDIPLD